MKKADVTRMVIFYILLGMLFYFQITSAKRRWVQIKNDKIVFWG